MSNSSPISLPEFKTIFDYEVYSIDFMSTEFLDLSNPDPNVLKRGFLVLERYRRPTLSEVKAYLKKTIEHHLNLDSSSVPDRDFSPLIANLHDQETISLLKGNPENISALVSKDLITTQQDDEQYLQAQYFTLSAPLYIQQGNKIKEPEWYHDAFNDVSLLEKGMQHWFLIRLNYISLLEPEKVITKINQSSLLDKEGTAYVMENVCRTFSLLEHFARLKDGTSRKVKEAALEYLVNVQKEEYASVPQHSKEGLTIN